MPVNYNYTQDGQIYSFDDVFVPADAFRAGNLWLWGQNNQSQLGNNESNNSFTPITTFAGGTNWKQVACGYRHTAAIKTDGTLWAWGQNNIGQLGDNTVISKITPVTTFSGGTNWKQVSCGQFHTAAIKTDGTLWTWGNSTYGQLGANLSGLGDRSFPVTTFAGGNNWKQVSAGKIVTAAIKTDGTLWTWGFSNSGQLGNNDSGTNMFTPITTFAGGTNWKQVSCGGANHLAAIKTDGTLWTWGSNNVGQLGDNSGSNRFTPVTTFAGGTNWKQISTTGYQLAAIKTDGTLWTWGLNIYGVLGDNTITQRNTPVTTFAGGSNWKLVAASRLQTAAIKTDGTLWIWGGNAYGQLGDFSTVIKITPVPVYTNLTNWRYISSGYSNTQAAITYEDPII